MNVRTGYLAAALVALLAGGCTKKDDASAGGGSGNATTSADAGNSIKLGQTIAYSGNASAYGIIGKVDVAYFKMVNDKGGINGRTIDLLSVDDGYLPAKALEQTRKLVESDNVLAIFGSVGTAAQTAVHSYLNDHKVPQIFLATGADKWADPKFPWTIGYQPSYRTEGRIFAKYIKANKPTAKVCVLQQNDDFGKDYQVGLKTEWGDQLDKMVIKTATYEVTDPTIDSQVVTLQSSGCDTIILATTPKFAAQALRKIYDLGWKPTELLTHVAGSISAVLKVAGAEKSTGVIVGAFLKDASDPALQSDPGIVEFKAFLKKYAPDVDPTDWNAMYGYTDAVIMAKTLEQCGSDVSRDGLMKTALHLKDLKIPTVIDGITVSTSPENPRPMKQMRLSKFNGTSYELFGEVLSAE
jgi:branched-chain amino acid transport system substrate-binding protein